MVFLRLRVTLSNVELVCEGGLRRDHLAHPSLVDLAKPKKMLKMHLNANTPDLVNELILTCVQVSHHLWDMDTNMR